jgi:hypothetical protein
MNWLIIIIVLVVALVLDRAEYWRKYYDYH